MKHIAQLIRLPEAERTVLGRSAGGREISVDLAARLRHTAIVGATGMGKSTLMRSMIRQDIARGDGVLVIDPHGTLAADVLRLVPQHRYNHVCLIDLADTDASVGFNLVAASGSPDVRALAISSTISMLRSIWGNSWGARLEEILKSTLAILAEQPGATLAWIPRLLTDADWRAELLARTSDPLPHAFFEHVFDRWPAREQSEAVSPVFNKISALLHPPAIRYSVGQHASSLDLAQAMDRGRIVVVNLAKGAVDDIPAYLYGALFLARLKTAALARDASQSLRPFHVYLDEAQDFGTESVTKLLGQVRKYGVSLTLATQHLSAFGPELRASLIGNVRTVICFRLGMDDAPLFAPLFDRDQQPFNPLALRSLDEGEAMLHSGAIAERLLTDATVPDVGDAAIVIKQSRRNYAVPRRRIAAAIDRSIAA